MSLMRMNSWLMRTLRAALQTGAQAYDTDRQCLSSIPFPTLCCVLRDMNDENSPSPTPTPSCLATPCAPTLGRLSLRSFRSSPPPSISSALRFFPFFSFSFSFFARLLSPSSSFTLAASTAASSRSCSNCNLSFRFWTSWRILRSQTSLRRVITFNAPSLILSCKVWRPFAGGGLVG